MNKYKNTIIFIIFFLLSVFQIYYLSFKSAKQLSFYPKWTVYLDKKYATISSPQGFFAQLTMQNDDDFSFKNELHMLSVGDGTNPLLAVNMVIKYCDNCYLIDTHSHRVFTQKQPNDDIVLKKKIIDNGYAISPAKNVNFNRDLKLTIFNAISGEMILVDSDKMSINIDDEKKELNLVASEYKLTFAQ